MENAFVGDAKTVKTRAVLEAFQVVCDELVVPTSTLMKVCKVLVAGRLSNTKLGRDSTEIKMGPGFRPDGRPQDDGQVGPGLPASQTPGRRAGGSRVYPLRKAQDDGHADPGLLASRAPRMTGMWISGLLDELGAE